MIFGKRATLGTYLEAKLNMKHNINDNQIESISRILGDALTGSVITKIFESCSIKEKKSFFTYGGRQMELSQSKWARIYDTFHDMIIIKCGDEGYFFKFIEISIDPSRFYGNSSNQ